MHERPSQHRLSLITPPNTTAHSHDDAQPTVTLITPPSLTSILKAQRHGPHSASASLRTLRPHPPHPSLTSSSCLTSDDCHGFPCALPPSTSTLSTGTCSCPASRYEADGSLSLSSPSPTCSSTLSDLQPALFLTTRILLFTLYSLLFLACLAHLQRLHLTRSPSSITSPHPPSPVLPRLLSLLPTLALTLLSLLYLSLDPLTTSSRLSPLPSSFLLLSPDPFLLLSYLSLFPRLRDTLLLSPLTSDTEYNTLVHTTRTTRSFTAAGIVTLALLPLALGWGGVGVLYLAAWMGVGGVYTAYVVWRLYGLAGRDRRAIRRVSITTGVGPATRVGGKGGQGTLGGGDTSWMVAETSARGLSESLSMPPSKSSLPTLSPRPSDSPQSSGGGMPSVTSHLDLQPPHPPSSHALSAQPMAKGGRRVSLVVSGGVGQKPVKAYAMDRVNVRRLIRIHTALALAFIAVYVYVLAVAAPQPQPDVLFFAPRMTGRTVVVVYLVKGVLTWGVGVCDAGDHVAGREGGEGQGQGADVAAQHHHSRCAGGDGLYAALACGEAVAEPSEAGVGCGPRAGRGCGGVTSGGGDGGGGGGGTSTRTRRPSRAASWPSR